MADLVIRGGTVVDGSGAAPFAADVAITDGRISDIGRIAERGREEIEADGLIVTPGFVDIHTHYDGQAVWDSHLAPSAWHGVTTALMGNCGVGFAPCREADRDRLIELMEGVEDIPGPILHEGLDWRWETFPEYLDALDAKPRDIDIGTLLPHGALRVHVMGERAEAHAEATEAECAEMARLAAEGLAAGAVGISTSRALAHRTLDGRHIPTLGAPEAELEALARTLRAHGSGWLQVISDFDDPAEEEFARLRRVAAVAGRPLTFSLLQRESKPGFWRWLLDRVEEANAAGVPMFGQVMGRPVGLMFGFELSQHPFLTRASYRDVAHLPLAERVAALRDPARRARILSEPTDDAGLKARLNNWDKIFPLGDPPDYEPPPERSVAAMAAARGMSPEALCYDLMLERDGRAILNRPLLNYADGDLAAIREMMTHPHTLMGLGDGGAHVGYICDASCMTHMLVHWARDRTRGPKLAIEQAVKRISADNAAAMGLADRGVVAAGRKADINVIDFARLRMRAPEMHYDLPAGGKRLVQRAEGYVATILSGAVTYREGEATGALPGRLVRGASGAG